MEVLPWATTCVGIPIRCIGFNPCSGGSIALGVRRASGAKRDDSSFQSLFWWKYCPGPENLTTRTPRETFQSLFWWKYCPGCHGTLLLGQLESRFNPCSGGSIALGCRASPAPGYTYRWFQSLFWWKYCPGYHARDARCQRDRVSILVLVEVLPWAAASVSGTADGRCFNPCSGGSIALGRSHRMHWYSAESFQSLFWWKYCPGHIMRAMQGVNAIVFQSLFWWKYCPGSDSSPSKRSRLQSFNPCSGGSIALGNLTASNCRLQGILFQSLFWWKYCPGAGVPDRIRVFYKFQSLFWWKYCPGARDRVSNLVSDNLFQSLFWWKYCPGKGPQCGCSGPRVSILVLVEVLPWEGTAVWLFGAPCFNPCSGGSIALGGPFLAEWPASFQVSILVLVEVLPWAKRLRCGEGCAGTCFNPCSGGSIALGQEGHILMVGKDPMFQSLFWWKYCPGYRLWLRPLAHCPVSILVLVEVLPWARRDYEQCAKCPEFQSLFWWKYCPGTITAVSPGVRLLFQSLFWWKYCPGLEGRCKSRGQSQVSILVLVEVLPWVSLGLKGQQVSIEFQSLFWWKYCPGSRGQSQQHSCPPVSILVLVEVLPWVRRFRNDQRFVSLFQSLFWWKYCPGRNQASLRRPRWICFNPCSGGSIALGRPPSKRRPCKVSSFNPCSGGSIALGPEQDFVGGGVRLVSILVLVEVLPWGNFDQPGFEASIPFQSLFWWKYCPGLYGFSHQVFL